MRTLNWSACVNVRDLGGLSTRHGDTTVFGRMVRADSLDRLDDDGVASMRRYGISTIIDMRDARERDATTSYESIERLHLPLEDQSDEEFWQKWRHYNSTPIYYRAFLNHCPERVRSVFEPIALAPPGGIVFHCGSGRDRTGLIAILLLNLVGVSPEQIVGDYCLSAPNLKPLGQVKDQEAIEAAYKANKTDAETEILALLSDFDAETYLLDSGLSREMIELIRSRITTSK